MKDHLHAPELTLRPLRWLSALLTVSAALALLATLVAAEPGRLLGAWAGLTLAVTALLLLAVYRRAHAAIGSSQAWLEVGNLRERLALHESVLSALPAPIASWSPQGQPLVTNRAWAALGLAADSPPETAELRTGEPARTFMVENAAGDFGRLALLREVTAERNAVRAKDDLLAVVGHELRNPLSSIKGYGQLMTRQLATVQEQVQRLDRLIDDVLEGVQAESGRLALERERLDPAILAQAAASRFRGSYPEHRLRVELEACPAVEGDPTRLGQVLDNLLSNAAKYSPKEADIALRVSADGSWVRLAVADQGIGIAPEHLPRLFDRFYRVQTGENGDTPGSGLGLAVVRDLAEAHGGRVEAASHGPGRGSTFTVWLPGVAAATTPTDRVPAVKTVGVPALR